MWDSGVANQLPEASFIRRKALLIPFTLKFRLPKLRKERIIFDPSIKLRVNRDVFGRIVSSKVPKRRLFR